MKHMRAVVNVTTNRPKRRPIAQLVLVVVVVVASCEVSRAPKRSAFLLPPDRNCSALNTLDADGPRQLLYLLMQLRHAQRQLLSRCTLRWYSVGTVPANDTSQSVPASGTPASPPRLKRPLATSFGGISIGTSVPSISPVSCLKIPSRKFRDTHSKASYRNK
jgi:hypothetical protein